MTPYEKFSPRTKTTHKAAEQGDVRMWMRSSNALGHLGEGVTRDRVSYR